MKLRPQLRSDIKKVLWITIAFILIDWFLTFYTDAIIETEYTLGPSDLYSLDLNLFINTLTGLVAGILGGSVLVYVQGQFFRKRSYGYALKATFVSYSLVFVIVTVISVEL